MQFVPGGLDEDAAAAGEESTLVSRLTAFLPRSARKNA
jgi:hypothetical protein